MKLFTVQCSLFTCYFLFFYFTHSPHHFYPHTPSIWDPG